MSCDLTLGLNYTINKHLALHVDYNHQHAEFVRSHSPGYSRNRYFAGVTYTLLKITD